jgi:hypothetical protein
VPTIVCRGAALIVLVAGLGACARNVSVGNVPGPTYAIEVRNAFDIDMIVSYDDGGGPRVLGTVSSNRTERFVIAGPARTSIHISAVDVERNQSFGPVSVELAIGETAQIVLQ